MLLVHGIWSHHFMVRYYCDLVFDLHHTIRYCCHLAFLSHDNYLIDSFKKKAA